MLYTGAVERLYPLLLPVSTEALPSSPAAEVSLGLFLGCPVLVEPPPKT